MGDPDEAIKYFQKLLIQLKENEKGKCKHQSNRI
jgi:hypothetical protein